MAAFCLGELGFGAGKVGTVDAVIKLEQ